MRLHHEFALVTRPGNRFRIDGKFAFGGFQFGELRIGSDGQELWVLPANGMFRRAVTLAQRERLMKGFGDMLDLGYLDVHDLVEKLPRDFELRVVGREKITLPAGTFDAFRIEAIGSNLKNGARLERTAWVAPERFRGMLARETLTQNGQVVSGERIELTGYSQTTPRPAASISPFSY